jgi:predicted DNA-binding transcriptional regulator AlpA
MEPLSIDQIRRLPATIDVPTAGRAFGFGRAKAYRLAKDGTFPCKITKIGRNYRVSVAHLRRALNIDTHDE